MYRTGQYIMLLAAAVLLQVFFFDNLSLWVYFSPLVYVVFIMLLPLDSAPIKVLLLGLLTGAVTDAAMGTAGLNTIAALASAYFRRPLLGVVMGRDNAAEGGVPSPGRMGRRNFMLYMLAFVALHCAVFFGFEAFTTAYLWHQLARFAVSTASSVAFVWALALLFTSKLAAR